MMLRVLKQIFLFLVSIIFLVEQVHALHYVLEINIHFHNFKYKFRFALLKFMRAMNVINRHKTY